VLKEALPELVPLPVRLAQEPVPDGVELTVALAAPELLGELDMVLDGVAVALSDGTLAKALGLVVGDGDCETEPLELSVARGECDVSGDRLGLLLPDELFVPEEEPLVLGETDAEGEKLGKVATPDALGDREGARERVSVGLAVALLEAAALREEEGDEDGERVAGGEREPVGDAVPERVGRAEAVDDGVVETEGVGRAEALDEGDTLDVRVGGGERELVGLAVPLRETVTLEEAVAVESPLVGELEALGEPEALPEPLGLPVALPEPDGVPVTLGDEEPLTEPETVGWPADGVADGLAVGVRETLMEREPVGVTVPEREGRREKELVTETVLEGVEVELCDTESVGVGECVSVGESVGEEEPVSEAEPEGVEEAPGELDAVSEGDVVGRTVRVPEGVDETDAELVADGDSEGDKVGLGDSVMDLDEVLVTEMVREPVVEAVEESEAESVADPVGVSVGVRLPVPE